MIDGLGKVQPPRLDVVRGPEIKKTAAVSGAAAAATEQADTPKPAADMAAHGAPVDSAKVARIKAAIADGSYTVNADAIAAKMIEQDIG
ncbi:flagellar biosynthesis anti-sigma factor FlgM [Sphingomonas naphthae]|uniref:Negative regulator of flagellin synthesis n=1 Tax=Sphingomonas naphthae TaxID=1813468 RepID=A0ABY7TL08_9SPHN|nr:flagellar biosynthesis anti-sigma factor FlgM [Sphingomonas naphthae]WCT73635.1 flagellar biosynthesis anti-sigma factor FlgM [Sphingomonas naphthae]